MEDNNKSRPRRPLLIVSLFLFLTSVLAACGGGGGGSGSSDPAVNRSPIITSEAVTAATEEDLYRYIFGATDEDAGDTMTLSARVLPAWLVFDAATGVLSGTPANSDVGAHDVTLRVSDGEVDVDQSFVITVTNVNDAPEITSTAVMAATEDDLYSYTFVAMDVDVGDTLTLDAPVKPAWLNFDTDTGVLSGTPANADVGTHDVTLRTSDEEINVDQSFVITVTNVNDAPVITSDVAPSVAENTTAVTTVMVTDDDGDTPTFSITGVTADDALFSITAGGVLTFLAAPDFETPGDIDFNNIYNIEVTADDGNGGIAVQNIAVTVTDANDAPVFTSSAAPSVVENTTAVTTVTATDDDSDTPTFSITGVTADDALFSITAGGVLTFLAAPDFETPGDIGTDNVYDIEITADDGNGGTAAQNIAVTVTDVNNTPVANDDSSTVTEDLTINIDLAGNDTGDDIDLTSIIIASQPSNGVGILTANLDGTVDYTHDGSSTIQDSFTYTIDDANGNPSAAATVNITVLQRFNEAMYARADALSATGPHRIHQVNDGRFGGDNGWVANTTNTGEWVQLDFDSPKSIYQFTIADRAAINDQVEDATVQFYLGGTGGTLVHTIVTGALTDNGTPVEFTFTPKLIDTIKVTVDAVKAGSSFIGFSEIQAFAPLGPSQLSQKTELFDDGDVSDWLVVDDCIKDTPIWALDTDYYTYTQTGKCRGYSPDEGVELGTYAILDGVASDTFSSGLRLSEMDLRIKLKSGTVAVGNWVNGAIGVLFAYRSPTDYYRLDFSQAEGHTSLWKEVGGVITELATSPQSYASDTWVNLRILRQTNGDGDNVIVVYKDDVKIMAVIDNEVPLNNGDYRVGLLCARNESCNFDTMTIHNPPSGTPGTPNGSPIVGLNIDDDAGAGSHTSGEYYVDTSGTLDLTAVVTDTTGVTGVEFEVDGDTGNAQMDVLAPYTASFGSLTTGNHTVRAYLHDESGRLSAAEATEELPLVGVSGIHLVGLGDSITGGLRDDDPSDDTSGDGRNTSGGYQSVLNDLLREDNGGMPVTVLNEGNPGEASAEGAARIAAVLARNPAAQGYLAIYGANDSGDSVDSGLGETCTEYVTFSGCTGTYIDSFKHNMQQIINAVVGAGKAIYLAKAPPYLIADVGGGARDLLIREYNDVIEELITINLFSYTPPDFHVYFTATPGQMFNETGDVKIHPDGTGYRDMAGKWCTALNGQAGISCSP